MKAFNTLLFLFIITFVSLQAQDVAFCGWDGTTGDKFTFVLLRNFNENEVIYFTEEDYSDASNSFSTSEGHLSWTVPAGGLLENDVIQITEDGSNNYIASAGTAIHVIGSWSFTASD